jgi:glutathione S-transferase
VLLLRRRARCGCLQLIDAWAGGQPGAAGASACGAHVGEHPPLVLVDKQFTIADVSVFPRVAMYPLVQLPIEPARYPNVCAWLGRVGRRPSVVQSEAIGAAR